MLSRVRLLPVVIFVASLILTLKAGSIWVEFGNIEGGIEVQTARAQETPQLDPQVKKSDEEKANKKRGSPVSTQPGDKGQEENIDPLEFSRSEILILQELSQRRKALDRRERQITRREGLLQAAELKLVTKQGELKKIRQDIKSLLGAADEKEKARLQNLVKIYESMKPKDAARIFNELDMTVLMGVVAKMSVRKVAMIISAMEVKKARVVTRELAEQKKPFSLPK